MLQHTPLTDAQKALPSGMIFPSGEANYYDFAQSHEYHGSSGINAIYPSPADFSQESGIIKTDGPDGELADTSGIFNSYNLSSQFSNSNRIDINSITEFSIFNPYIHYATGVDGVNIQIPYISTYSVSSEYDPYTTNPNTIVLNSTVNNSTDPLVNTN